MRFPNLVRPLVCYEVDRFEVEVQQCMQLTNTNRSRAYPKRKVLYLFGVYEPSIG